MEGEIQTVSMIGLGSVGSALAKAFAATDLDVTLWNRTSDKCDAMVSGGAAVADSMSEAVDRSDVIVVCVRGYDVATDLFRLADVAALLAGKIVVQLGNGVPAEVSDAAHWFSEHDAAYIDGSIMTFPDDVGSADCQVLVSGDPAAVERCRPVTLSISHRFLRRSDPEDADCFSIWPSNLSLTCLLGPLTCSSVFGTSYPRHWRAAGRPGTERHGTPFAADTA